MIFLEFLLKEDPVKLPPAPDTHPPLEPLFYLPRRLRTYLVGERLSLADVSVALEVSALLPVAPKGMDLTHLGWTRGFQAESA